MSQRPSTSGVLSCHPWQGLGFLSKMNYPALAALLSSTSFLGKWVWPLQIFVMALHNICVQTLSGPHLTCKVISYGYSAYDSPAKALPCCSSSILSREWPSRLKCHLHPWHLGSQASPNLPLFQLHGMRDIFEKQSSFLLPQLQCSWQVCLAF